MIPVWIRQARHAHSMKERKQNKKQIEREEGKLKEKTAVPPPRGCG